MLRYATNLQIEGGFIQVMDAHQGKLELSDAVTVYVPFDESYSVAVRIGGCAHDEFSCCTTEFVAGAQRKGLISGQLAVRIDGAVLDGSSFLGSLPHCECRQMAREPGVLSTIGGAYRRLAAISLLLAVIAGRFSVAMNCWVRCCAGLVKRVSGDPVSTISPASKNTTCWAMFAARRKSCVVINMVIPSLA